VKPGAVVVAVAIIVVAGGGLVTWRALPAIENRVQFGTFDLSAPPERIDYCDRRYYPGNGGAAVVDGLEPMRQIGSTPGGFSYFANLTPDTVRSRFSPSLSCTMVIYVKVAGGYRVYALSRGP
jgi:hypothetical protein